MRSSGHRILTGRRLSSTFWSAGARTSKPGAGYPPESFECSPGGWSGSYFPSCAGLRVGLTAAGRWFAWGSSCAQVSGLAGPAAFAITLAAGAAAWNKARNLAPFRPRTATASFGSTLPPA